jgi:hypothetical protein
VSEGEHVTAVFPVIEAVAGLDEPTPDDAPADPLDDAADPAQDESSPVDNRDGAGDADTDDDSLG